MVSHKHLDYRVITFVASYFCHLVVIGVIVFVAAVIVSLKLILLRTSLWLETLVVAGVSRILRWIEDLRCEDIDVSVLILIVSTD